MIKMLKDEYGYGYVPEECCSITNPVTSGGKPQIDDVELPCGDCGIEAGCKECIIQKVFDEYAKVSGQDQKNGKTRELIDRKKIDFRLDDIHAIAVRDGNTRYAAGILKARELILNEPTAALRGEDGQECGKRGMKNDTAKDAADSGMD